MKKNAGVRLSSRDPRVAHRREVVLGLFGVAALLVLLAATTLLYLAPIGEKTYTAEMDEARGLTTASEVRVAGVPVGTVTEMTLHDDRVTMTFTVKSSVFVGDASSLDVRLLTFVGGHYITLTSAGSTPLGDTPIPAERVRLPYNLMRTLQDSVEPVREIDATTLRANLVALQTSVDNSPDALRSTGRAMESIVAILNRQTADISRGLDVGNEYLSTIANNKSILGEFLGRIRMIEVRGLAKKDEIALGLRLTAELLSRVAAVEPIYREKLEPIGHSLLDTRHSLQDLLAKLGPTLDSLQEVRRKLEGMAASGGLQVDGAAPIPTGPPVCVPVFGRSC